MENIPFKQTETVTNEFVLALILVVGILALAAVFCVRYIRKKGIVLFKARSESKIKVIESKQMSASTQIHIVEIAGKQFILTESNKNTSVTELSNKIVKETSSNDSVQMENESLEQENPREIN